MAGKNRKTGKRSLKKKGSVRLLLILPFFFLVSCGSSFETQKDHPFWNRLPVVIGHRGGLGPYPQNTIPALFYGLSHGAGGVEFDVQRCKSGEIIVFHDYDVEDLTDGTGQVVDLTLTQLQSLTYDYRSDFIAQPAIPTLIAVLDSLPPDVLIDIELKGESAGSDGLEDAVVRLVRDRRLEDRTILTSFNPFRIRRIEKNHPDILTGLITGPDVYWYVRSPLFISWCRADAVIPFCDWADNDYLDRRPGHRMIAWFDYDDISDSEAEYRRLLSLEIDGIITDHPALLSGLIPF